MIPEKIGRYEVQRELGRGGMAVVYLAYDPNVKRQVAVKVLPRQFTFDRQFRARFEREAQTIAGLEHPAIVPIYDFGDHDDQPYIVMRFMPGGSLADMLKRHGPLSVAESARILQVIGSALDEAHSKGIVHRDLKPANILFDQRGFPAIADFGIVKVSEATAAYTGSAIIGTPGYMSPEQARGDGQIDARSDIYALGTILFEMLTGRLPFQADTPMGVVMKHILEPAPSILQIKPDLPAGCEPVVSKALAKERNARFASTSEMAQALAVAAGGAVNYLAPAGPTEAISQVPWATPTTTPLSPPAVKPGTGSQRAAETEAVAPETGSGQLAAPEARRTPAWVWVIGCLGLAICSVVALSAAGVLSTVLGTSTPTPAVAEATGTAPADTPAPASTPNPAADFVGHENDQFGLTFGLPETWHVGDQAEYIVVASDEELLDIGQLEDFTAGGILLLTASDLEGLETVDPAALLQLAADNFDLSADAAIVDAPARLEINGQMAATAVMRGTTDDNGTPFVAMVTVIVHGRRLAVALGVTPASGEESFRPVLDAIVQTVEVTEPAAAFEPNGLVGFVSYGETVSGAVDNASTGSSWGFSGSAGDILDIEVVPLDSDFDLIVDVVNAQGESVLRNGAVDLSLGVEVISRLRLQTSGEYYIVVTGYSGSTGDYELTVGESQSGSLSNGTARPAPGAIPAF